MLGPQFFSAGLTLCLLASAFSVRGAEPARATSRPAPTLRVAAVQMRSTRDLAKNIRKIEERLAECASDGVRVVTFPECALTGYFDDAFMQSFSVEQLAVAEKQLVDA